MYYLTFTAIDQRDNVEKVYEAKVWDKPITQLHLVSFKEIIQDPGTARRMREEVEAVLKKITPRPESSSARTGSSSSARTGLSSSSAGIEHAYTLYPTRRELHSLAFRFLVKELQIENKWKYARAKRAASRKWKSFSAIDKVP